MRQDVGRLIIWICVLLLLPGCKLLGGAFSGCHQRPAYEGAAERPVTPPSPPKGPIGTPPQNSPPNAELWRPSRPNVADLPRSLFDQTPLIAPIGPAPVSPTSPPETVPSPYAPVGPIANVLPPEPAGKNELIRNAKYPTGDVLAPFQLITLQQHMEAADKAENAQKFAPSEIKGPTRPPLEKKMKEPLVAAMEQFLANQPDKAIHFLQAYDRSNQELFLRVLPVMAQLTHKKIDQLTHEELTALYNQLDQLLLDLRSRTELIIDEMCFCESVQTYGVYRALPKQHVFRAKSNHHLGELVQVYVQLRNLCSEKRGSHYETRLSSSVEITDKQGKQWWYFDFQDQNQPLRSQTMRRDHFNNYSFYVPHIPAGEYWLTIQVKDLTNPAAQRVVRKSLPFLVGS